MRLMIIAGLGAAAALTLVVATILQSNALWYVAVLFTAGTLFGALSERWR